MKSINPFTNKVVETYSEHSDADAKRIIKEVDLAYKSWKQSTFEERASHLLQLEKQLLEQQEFLADLIVTEMGKVKKNRWAKLKNAPGCVDIMPKMVPAFWSANPLHPMLLNPLSVFNHWVLCWR